MSNGETPGIGGVPGLAKPSTRAPRAWAGMVKAIHRDLPKSLRKSQHYRRQIRALRHRRRRVR